VACEPGRYITLINGAGTARNASVANNPGEGHIELHIRLLADGLLSQYLMKEITMGARGRAPIVTLRHIAENFWQQSPTGKRR